MLAYLIAGVMLVGSLVGFVAMERKAGGDAVRRELQPKLTACQASVKAQNDAFEALKAEGAKKTAKAAKALAKATTDSRVWEDEAAWLRKVLEDRRKAAEAGGKPLPTDCAAAWDAIRGAK